MREDRAIITAAAALFERRTPFLLATVVNVRGSSYRRPGARLLATSEGRVAGNVSGGCLEADLIRTGFWRTRNGPVVVRYDSSDPEEAEIALGCGGVVDVLIEQVVSREQGNPLALLEEAVARERRAVMATVFRSTDPDIPLGTRWCRSEELVSSVHARTAGVADQIFSACATAAAASGEHASSHRIDTATGSLEVLVEPIVPPPHLFVFGAGLDAVPLVGVARQLGWTITVWSPSPSFASRSRFEGEGITLVTELDVARARIDGSERPVVVIMGHHIVNDRAALDVALASRALYIGILGPRHRTESLASELPARLEDPRVHAPVGLDLGAETPEEIAIAITAEMLASLHGGSGASLRQRKTIHRPAE